MLQGTWCILDVSAKSAYLQSVVCSQYVATATLACLTSKDGSLAVLFQFVLGVVSELMSVRMNYFYTNEQIEGSTSPRTL